MEIACFRKIKTNKFLVFNTPAHALYFDVEKMKKKEIQGVKYIFHEKMQVNQLRMKDVQGVLF